MNTDAKSLARSKSLLLNGLHSALIAHNEGKDIKIGFGYDEYDESLVREENENWTEKERELHQALHCGLRLWDEWADEANHGWPAFEGIEKDQWKEFAELLISDLEKDRFPVDLRLRRKFLQLEPTRFDRAMDKIKSLTSLLT